MTAAGVRPTAKCSWHLCTGGWSLRGDVRGTCPRSPCTVPAMCTDVSPPAASSFTAPAVPGPWPDGRVVACRSCPRRAIPAVVSIVVSKVVVAVRAPHAEEPPPSGGGGSSADPRWLVECPTKVAPGACAAGRCPGRHRRGTPHRPWA
jgi:hypothetical protein